MITEARCELCGSVLDNIDTSRDERYCDCPVCGCYIQCKPLAQLAENYDLNHLTSFLAYNGFKNGFGGNHYILIPNDDCADNYKTTSSDIPLRNPDVENWYPKTFAEKVDCILLFLDKKSSRFGQAIPLNRGEWYSAFFTIREYDYNSSHAILSSDCNAQTLYIIDYLDSQGYIKMNNERLLRSETLENIESITIMPKGYARIDTLQKLASRGKNAFVAMQFGEETKPIREAIRLGISSAGYNAIFIDEVQHNEFITPEILRHIKDSKFVVVDLTHQNNGAYFEEGYAMGLGKPVIQLCKSNVKLHFDVAQKNTIMWEAETEIPDKLRKRIEATID